MGREHSSCLAVVFNGIFGSGQLNCAHCSHHIAIPAALIDPHHLFCDYF